MWQFCHLGFAYLAAARNSVRSHVSVQPLDLATLTTARVAETSKDLAGLSRAELERDGGLRLQTGDGPTEPQHGLGLAHLLALVDQVLEPVVRSLDLPGHVGQLHLDDGVLNQLLAKRLALAGVADRLFVANTREPQGLDNDTHALVVEVGHDGWWKKR